MRFFNWKQPHKMFIIGLMVMSLVLDGSFLLLPLATANNLAYAQNRNDNPQDQFKKKGNNRPQAPGKNTPGREQARQGNRPGNVSPNVQRKPQQQPGNRSGIERKRNPSTTPLSPDKLGYPGKPAHYKRPPEPPRKKHHHPTGPYYGHGRPLPPRPKHIHPPVGPGPWQTTPWAGRGVSPWWYGRPFLWTMGAAATATAIAGITYYLINGTYYRPYAQGQTTVYVQVESPY